MGTVILRYSFNKLIIPFDTLANEIEYGTTFALYRDREDIIPLRGDGLQWISWRVEDKNFIIEVDDVFLEEGYIFEKILVTFLYNLLDFGMLQLISIDLSKSSYSSNINAHQKVIPKYFRRLAKNSILGTILKPYYHLSLKQKIKMAERFTYMGIELLKEDETFLVPESRLMKEAEAIQSAINGSGYYIPNITHYIYNYRVVEKLLKLGIELIMVDFLVTGFRPIFNLKQKFPELSVWGHRVGYWSLKKFISMEAIGILAVLAGIDFLHVGTPKNEKEAKDKLQLVSKLQTIKPQFIPVFTKTTPEILQEILSQFNGTTVSMACGYFRNDEGLIDWDKVQKWIKSARFIE